MYHNCNEEELTDLSCWQYAIQPIMIVRSSGDSFIYLFLFSSGDSVIERSDSGTIALVKSLEMQKSIIY